MQGATPFTDTRWIRSHWNWSGGLLKVLGSEFKRAIAAEQRYRSLKYADPQKQAGHLFAREDAARRIFNEFYSSDAVSAL